jgi:GAF domain-containing protein
MMTLGASEAKGGRPMAKTGRRGRRIPPQARRKPRALKKAVAPAQARGTDLKRQLAEARAQQAATAEILKVISRSPGDVQPTFRAILKSTTRMCESNIAALFLYDGAVLTCAAHHNTTAQFAKALQQLRTPPSRETATRLAALERKVVHVHDYFNDPRFNPLAPQKREGGRTMLSVPLLRDGSLVGVITTWRREVRPFSDQHIALLQTFADQAVIAIENVRLFNETREALERQTATAEILKVIASSPTDVHPVMDSIAESAARLCEAYDAVVMLRRGDNLHYAAHYGPIPTDSIGTALPITRGLVSGRVVLEARQFHFADLQVETEEFPEGSAIARKHGFRAALNTPLLREGTAIGVIVVRRQEAQPFNDKQIALIRTFADQAVIAIENVRLFNELEARNRDVTDALERQTATAEILKVISGSPTDVQPVFDSIVKSALRLFSGQSVGIILVDGDRLQIGSVGGEIDLETARKRYPLPLNRETVSGQAILDRSLVNIADTEAPEMAELLRVLGREIGYRAIAAAPMMRDGAAMGAIAVLRKNPGALNQKEVALLQTFADQAVIAIENVRLFKELEARNRDVTDALEQQKASADVLGAISGSITDTKPVFDKILERCERLFEGNVVGVTLATADGKIDLAAYHGADYDKLKSVYPLPLSRESGSGVAILDASVAHYPDIEAAGVPPGVTAGCRTIGVRAIIFAPMLFEGRGVGAIWVGRANAGMFTEKQVALLRTFADQAVIAIQNARLFNETREALERQTATAEILRVISRSVEDTSPVFDSIVEACVRLFPGHQVGINLIGADGRVYLQACHSPHREALKEFFRRGPERRKGTSFLLKRRVAHFPDVQSDPEVPDEVREGCNVTGARAFIYAPMASTDRGIGTIWVGRERPGPFSDKEIALLQTFADQAVIAIQNARLFNETKEALEKQTATADILQVLSGSPSDTQPVFEAIVRHAARLCESTYANVFRYDGERIHLAASQGGSPEALAALRASYPAPPNRTRVIGRVVESGQAVRVEDTLADADYDRAFAGTLTLRRLLGVPLLRAGRAVGGITVGWAEPGPVRTRHEDLLKTFADQAVIAIENVRLYNETKEALERQTATAEILAVIGGSMTDAQPVFNAIVKNCSNLLKGSRVALWLIEADQLHPRATNREFTGEPMPIDRGSAIGVCVLDGCMVHLPDLEKAAEQYPRIRQLGMKYGYRSGIYSPLLREGRAIGGISVLRRELGAFDDKAVVLLKTFADQAVIAIENVRLFNELQSRTEALTKSVGQLTALGEVGQAISSTLDLETVLKTIVSRAVQLTGLDGGSIYEYDERTEQFQLQAAENMAAELVEEVRRNPIRKGDGAVGHTAVTLEAAQVPDILDDSYKSARKELLIRAGYRAILVVPLLREDHLLGALLVNRGKPGRFPSEVVELLKTFATQSAMAIQNARLFREIAQKGKQLEVASRHKSDFLSSMSHELRTPLNAILGFNEMILGQVYGEVPKDMQEPLADIQTSGKHLLRLINNVLDLAKIEAGRMELALSDYSVHDTVASVHATLRPLAAEKGLEFLATVPNDVPLAYGDGGRMTQCLMNLAGNSLKFTKAGKVEIAVETKGELLIYKVTDTGIGIPPDKIGSLFTEFKQTDATIASEYGGTGLGLSISRKFVEMHGGRIRVESEPGKGSAFIIEVPLRVKTT